MFNIFDELKIGLVAREKQDCLEREAAVRRLLSEAHTRQNESRKERRFFVEFLALAFKAFGTNDQMNWKL